MSNYKLTFKLKQHTPIIHFQYDQTGATLRATELKPKLDRFLIDKLGGLLAFDKYKNFLIGDYKEIEQGLKKIDDKNNLTEEQKNKQKEEFLKKQHLALDYKVRVEVTNSEKIKILNNKSNNNDGIKKIPFFFGNMGRDYNDGDLGLNFASEPFDVTITSFKNNKLLQKIKENIVNFFSVTNFGTRQSKGYGSFEVISVTYLDKTESTNHNAKLFRYYFKLSLKNHNINNTLGLLENVEWFYKSLRPGINYYNIRNKNLYFKSALFMFLNSEGIQWDKKTIKAHYFNRGNLTIQEAKKNRNRRYRNDEWKRSDYTIEYLPTQQNKYPNSDILENPSLQDENLSKKLWKDLLGLSSEESWYSYRAQISKDEAYFNKRNKIYQKKNKERRDIDRLKSPILFKPIANGNELTIYFDVFDRTFEKVLGKKMLISMTSKYKRFINNTTKPINTTINNGSDLVLPFPDLNTYDNKIVFYTDFFDYAFNKINIKEHIKTSNIDNEKDKDIVNIKQILEDIYSQLQNKKQ